MSEPDTDTPGAHTTPDDDDDLDSLLAIVGLYREGPSTEQQVWDAAQPFYLPPEDVPTLVLWHKCGTQWHSGPEGKTGLNYPGFESCLRLQRRVPPHREQARIFECIQAMERATLEEWRKQRAAAAKH